jgi:hypothetical protein
MIRFELHRKRLEPWSMGFRSRRDWGDLGAPAGSRCRTTALQRTLDVAHDLPQQLTRVSVDRVRLIQPLVHPRKQGLKRFRIGGQLAHLN